MTHSKAYVIIGGIVLAGLLGWMIYCNAPEAMPFWGILFIKYYLELKEYYMVKKK